MNRLDPTNCKNLTDLRNILLRNTHIVPNLSKILDFLYIGSQQHAENIALLQEHGITHVINCAETSVKTGQNYYGDSFTYMGFKASDNNEYDIMKHFGDVYNFIENARKSEGKVFIHCVAGVNRSAALTVAYCMKFLDLSPVLAAQYVKNIRPQILTNDNFRRQLIIFAKEEGYIENK